MSLIFKALKKLEAEKERSIGVDSRGNLPSEQSEREGKAPMALPLEGATRAPIIESPMIEPILKGQPKLPRRVIVLIALLCASLGLLWGTRYWHNKTSTPEPQANSSQALQKTQSATDPAQQKAMQLFEEKQWAESKVLWEELTLISPTDADVYNNLGLTLKKLGQKKEAYQAYQKALALKPQHPQALNNMGVMLWSDGQKEEAKTYFQKAVEADKKYADPHFHLAGILEQEGNIKTAAGHYRQFLAQHPSLEETQKKKILEKVEALEKK